MRPFLPFYSSRGVREYMCLCLQYRGAVLKRGGIREVEHSIFDDVVDHGRGVVAPAVLVEPCLTL